jgi:predicted MFS family arabinose efflux permease
MREYLRILQYPGARSMILASFPARLAYGMIGLGFYFKTYHAVHSIAFAGFVAGINGVAGALTTSIRSSLLDRFGMRIPLRIFVPAYGASIVVLNFVNDRSLLVVSSLLLGICAPPINLSIRPLWRSIVEPHDMRKALAIDTSVMTIATVLGPVVVTYLSLSNHPASALYTCSALILLGGLSLSALPITRAWTPEVKSPSDQSIFKVPGIRLLMVEGILIGLGAGIFQIAVPAFTTIRHVEHLTGAIFSVMSCASIVGSLLAGIIGKKLTPLNAFIRNYYLWAIVGIPLFLTTPGWSLMFVTAFIGLSNGAQQVFYLEVIEAVRPNGTSASALGWMWTVEGSAASIGSWVGGSLSQTVSPQFCFGITSISVLLGLIVVRRGKHLLSQADRFGPRPD